MDYTAQCLIGQEIFCLVLNSQWLQYEQTIHCIEYLLRHACPTRARTGISDQMLDIGVRWVVEPTCWIPLFKRNLGISARQDWSSQSVVGLARPHCSWAPCPSKRWTRLPDNLPPVGLWCPTGLLVGQSHPTTGVVRLLSPTSSNSSDVHFRQVLISQRHNRKAVQQESSGANTQNKSIR
ncbi:hypothetical protein VP01_4760g1 [Puccinia sorghi]|uniref:Uncharacterized protein n=1 Tax=Puccinia sorghi TaxID=27349 RepID=A0A0L6UMR9_9BASI|nr:hypothetical protein VP01_4760g1 [Puccinia sorghi]